ncbi:MAG: Amidohydrolase [Candidatus Hinthialibacteria bacterium OLB16]|nr:MAG: Amidohydrolase [Candidatus Hinthialibacteria bacterium OLB16]
MSFDPGPEIRLHSLYTYRDIDRRFWEEHLEEWVPQELADAHVHIVHPRYQVETLTEEMKRDYWVNELMDMQDVETAEHCYRTLFPGRKVTCLAFGFPGLGWEIEGANLYLSEELPKRGWLSLAVIRPTWVAGQIEWWLRQPGIIGVKPYYTLIGYDRSTRDRYIESSIFDFLPHHQLEVLDHHHAWVTLHVPHADRLGHPGNIREIREIRRRYPSIILVIAHFGRSYTLPHAEEGLLPLADDPGLYFDNSAVLNPEVHRLALEHIGPDRILYGTDNPVFYMRGRRQWSGRTYVNRTSHPFYFNKDRESPDIEATYTLYTYEALRGFKTACQQLGLGSRDVARIFNGNARELFARANRQLKNID